MKKLGQSIFLFHILNLLFCVVLNNIYDWQGNFFMSELISYLVPNIIGFILNYLAGGFVEKLISNEFAKKIILPLLFFSINEISYFINENQMIFFGLFLESPPPGRIPVDKSAYILISLSAAISALFVFLRDNHLFPKDYKVLN